MSSQETEVLVTAVKPACDEREHPACRYTAPRPRATGSRTLHGQQWTPLAANGAWPYNDWFRARSSPVDPDAFAFLWRTGCADYSSVPAAEGNTRRSAPGVEVKSNQHHGRSDLPSSTSDGSIGAPPRRGAAYRAFGEKSAPLGCVAEIQESTRSTPVPITTPAATQAFGSRSWRRASPGVRS